MDSEKSMFLEEFNQYITRSYLKNSSSSTPRCLYNSEKSMKIFQQDLLKVYNFDEKIYTYEQKNKVYNYYIQSYNPVLKEPAFCYKEAIQREKAYEQVLTSQIEISREVINKNTGVSTGREIISSSINEMKILKYVETGGIDANNVSYPNALETGGFFINKKNVKSHAVFKETTISTWPKYNFDKNLHHISFHSIPIKSSKLRFKRPQYSIIDINDKPTKFQITISSNKTLASMNVIALISFLTKLSIDEINKYCVSKFSNNENIYDKSSLMTINLLCEQTKQTILENVSTFEKMTVDKDDVDFINQLFETSMNENKKMKTVLDELQKEILKHISSPEFSSEINLIFHDFNKKESQKLTESESSVLKTIQDKINNLFNENTRINIFKNRFVDYYVKIMFKEKYNSTINPAEKKKSKEVDDNNESKVFISMFNSDLLPCIDSFVSIYEEIGGNHLLNLKNPAYQRKMKGMTLLVVFEHMLVAMEQNPIYTHKLSITNRRISSPGMSFLDTAIDNAKNLILSTSTQIQQNIKSGSNKMNFNRKSQNTFTSMFNMQEDSSVIIKPFKETNFAQRLITPNLVADDSNISLNKNISKRDPDDLKRIYMAPVDTPDHGQHVGITMRLNSCSVLNDKTFEQHKNLIAGMFDFVKEFIQKNDGGFETLENTVTVTLVDESEIWIANINQTLVLELYKKLIEKKIDYTFDTNLIDIGLIPCYKKIIDCYFPLENTYRTLRINIGNKILFVPTYIVKDGVLEIENVKFDETMDEIKKRSFDFINQKYKIIEFLGPEQFAHSNVCENMSTFFASSEEKRKQYQYVMLNNNLNLSVLENMIFDISKTLGTRGIFATSQLKSANTSIHPDSLNNIAAGKFTNYVEEPCITNSVLLETRIPKQGFGLHILVAFMAYKDNIEDSIIVSEEAVNRGMFVTANNILAKGQVDFSNLQTGLDSINKYTNSYKKLGRNYVPELNTILEPGDALYGDASPKWNKNSGIYYLKDNSSHYNYLIPGRVDRMSLSSEDNKLNIKYTITVLHYLEKGHKMTNQNAQKSTVSKIANCTELPYNKYGQQPNLIISSASIISRKTINMEYQVIATNLYNLLPCSKETGDKEYMIYDSFSNINISSLLSYQEKIKKEYPELSDEEIRDIFYCEHVLYNPVTGNPLKQKIFMGPIYFTRATQISDEKISAVNKCQINKDGQPQGGGKKKGGSHRFGEMDFDLLGCYGASNMIYELAQDVFEAQNYIYFCLNCGTRATKINNNLQDYFTCINCENGNITPMLERHLLSKTSNMLLGLLNFRGIRVIPKNKEIDLIYPSELK